MKNRILTFVIGILTGAIIMTLIFTFINHPKNSDNMGNTPPNGNGQMYQPNGNMEEPPERPDGNMQMPPQ